jgi:hypothetical protein
MFIRVLMKVVIFSSGGNLKVAKCVARKLEKCADVKVWQEIFRRYTGEELSKALDDILSDVDYAIFVLTSDGRALEDRQTSQNNLMYELGRAMLQLGQENVFIICDSKSHLPTYHKTTVLNFYDATDPATLKDACTAIEDKIETAHIGNLSGEWKSEYPVPFIENHPVEMELVSVVKKGRRIKILSVANSKDDYYVAYAWFDRSNGHYFGRWKSTNSRRRGWLVLYLSQCEKVMYGWYTGKDRRGRAILGYWVMAKNDADKDEVIARLDEGRKRLPLIIRWPRAQRAFVSLKAKARKLNSKFLSIFMMF